MVLTLRLLACDSPMPGTDQVPSAFTP